MKRLTFSFYVLFLMCIDPNQGRSQLQMAGGEAKYKFINKKIKIIKISLNFFLQKVNYKFCMLPKTLINL